MDSNANTDADKLITFGQMAFEQGWYDQAREYFEQVLALDATNREAMKGLARANEILSRRQAMAAPSIGVRPEVPSEAPVESPPEPVATSKTRSISIGLGKLTLGRKVSVSGALLALFCFFLPWIELSCSGMRVISVSGIDMATNSSQTDSAGWMLFLVPLAALSVLVTIYLALGIPTLKADIGAAFESLEAFVGLIFTGRVYFVLQEAMQDALQDARTSSNLTFLDLPIPYPEFFLRFVYGYWGTLAGFVAVIVGSLLDWKESQSKPRDKIMHVLAGRDRTMYVLAGIVLSVVVLAVVWAMSVGTTPKGLENWLPLTATPTPTSAEVQEPTHGASVVIVEWTTEAEVDLAGFNLYRSESPDGPYVKVNATLIPGGSDSLLEGKYSYTDTNVVVGHTYYYKLEDVRLDGTTTLHGPIEVVAEKPSIPKPTPTPTPILAAEPAFEVKKVRYAWSIYSKTCVRAAVVIRNKGPHTVWLSDITFTVYDVNGKVLEVLPAWWIVPRIIRAGEAAYANAEAMEDLEDLEPSMVGELKVNFGYYLTDEEPQLLTVENFSGEESFIGYDVLGEVVNTSGETAGEIAGFHVAVALYDENNNLLDVLDTHVSTTLASGDRMGFRAGSSCGVSSEVWKQVKRFEGVADNLKFQW